MQIQVTCLFSLSLSLSFSLSHTHTHTPFSLSLSLSLSHVRYEYSYQGSFCIGGHAATATCKAFLLSLRITYTDGTTNVIESSSTDGKWTATTDANPIRYAHLYHGEQYDGRVVTTGSWSPAAAAEFTIEAGQPAVGAAKALGTPALLTMPPITAEKSYAPVTITKLGPAAPTPAPSGPFAGCVAANNSLGGVINEGASITLKCGDPTQKMTAVSTAAYGALNDTAGRFVFGTLADNSCADASHPPGCIFWQNFVTNSRTSSFPRKSSLRISFYAAACQTAHLSRSLRSLVLARSRSLSLSLVLSRSLSLSFSCSHSLLLSLPRSPRPFRLNVRDAVHPVLRRREVAGRGHLKANERRRVRDVVRSDHMHGLGRRGFLRIGYCDERRFRGVRG